MSDITDYGLQQVKRHYDACVNEVDKTRIALEKAKLNLANTRVQLHCNHNPVGKGGFLLMETECSKCGFVRMD